MDRNSEHDETLDRYWDGLLRGRPEDPPSELDPLSMAIVRQLSQRPPAEEVETAQTLVWRRLRSRHNGATTHASGGAVSHLIQTIPDAPVAAPMPIRFPRRNGASRLFSTLGLAAVLLLTLTGLFIGFILDGEGWRTLLGPSAPDHTWPMTRGNSARTGAVNESGLTVAPSVRWTYNAGDQFATTPIVSDDSVYFATTDMIALEATSGDELWRFPTGGSVDAFVLAEGRIFAASMDGNLYALNARNGREQWRVPVNPSQGSSIVADGDTVYVATSNGDLLALTATTGKEKWRTRITVVPAASASVSLGEGMIAIAISTEGITIVDRSSGDIRWLAPIISPFDTSIDPPVIAHGLVYVTFRDKIGNAPEGKLTAYRLETGTPAWTFVIPETHGIIAPVAVTDDAVIVAGSDQMLRSLDPELGVTRWSVPVGSMVLQPVTVAGETAFVVGTDRVLHAFALNDGSERWKLKITTGNLVGGVIVAGGDLFGATPDGVVVSLGALDP